MKMQRHIWGYFILWFLWCVGYLMLIAPDMHPMKRKEGKEALSLKGEMHCPKVASVGKVLYNIFGSGGYFNWMVVGISKHRSSVTALE